MLGFQNRVGSCSFLASNLDEETVISVSIYIYSQLIFPLNDGIQDQVLRVQGDIVIPSSCASHLIL